MRQTTLGIALSIAFIGALFCAPFLVFGSAFAQTPNPSSSAPPTHLDGAGNVLKLVLYTSFDPSRLAPVFNDFQKSQSISVQIESDQADLILGRLLREGAASAADAVLLPTLTRVERAATAGLLMPIPLLDLDKPIPAAYHDSGGHWVALTGFVRVIVVHSERVKPGEITHYEDLAKPALKDRLCLPPLGRLAARAFLAAQMIPDPLAAETWVKGVTTNAIPLPPADQFAPLDASDRGLLQALVDGKCDVALVNSQTLARLSDKTDDPFHPALDKLSAHFPTLGEGRGTPVEIIAIGVTRASAKREAAIKLIAFLTSDTGQRLLAEALWSYPLKPGIPLSNPVSRWGPFKADPTPLSLLLPLLPQAAALAARTGSL